MASKECKDISNRQTGMNKRNARVILCCVVVYITTIAPVFGQKKEVDLKDRRITLKTEKVYLGTVLGYLREVYDIPIGFEQSILERKDPESRFSVNSPGISYYPLETVSGTLRIPPDPRNLSPLHPVTVNVEHERLEDVLDMIFRQVDIYKWEINDGVVNIYPIKGRDDRFEKLLGLKINYFVFEGGKPIWEITQYIKSLPAFSAFMVKNNLYFNGVRSGPEGALQEMYGRKLKDSMKFSNLTFRELLNQITKIKRGAWILKWRFVSKQTGLEFIDIDI